MSPRARRSLSAPGASGGQEPEPRQHRQARRERLWRERRRRSVKETLGSIVLGFEVVIVFLAALLVFGLKALPPVPALAGGAAFIVALVVGLGLLRYPWGQYVGWALQLLLIASGFLVPALFFVGVLFVALWTYCMITGERMDRQNRARAAALAEQGEGPAPV